MAKLIHYGPYIRLRRIPGDRRLHVTESGSTISGYLAECSIEYPGVEVPSLQLELEESEYDLFNDGTDAARRVNISVDRLLRADIEALHVNTTDSWGWQELARKLHSVTSWLRNDQLPPCQHEDVIETPDLGDTTVPGVCVWCPVPLVKLNDQWIPA